MKLSEKQNFALRELIDATEMFLLGIVVRGRIMAEGTVDGKLKLPGKTLNKMVEQTNDDIQTLFDAVTYSIEAFTGEPD